MRNERSQQGLGRRLAVVALVAFDLLLLAVKVQTDSKRNPGHNFTFKLFKPDVASVFLELSVLVS